MRRITNISPLNPIRFTKKDQAKLYNTYDFDSGMFYNQILSWQEKENYAYKLQNLDRTFLQIQTNSGFPVKVKMYTCMGEEAGEGTFSLNAYPFPITIRTFNLRALTETADPGYYYFIIEIKFDDTGDGTADVTEYWQSEPVFIKPFHEGTILTEYFNSYNKDLIEFEQSGIRMCSRAEGAILDFAPAVNRVVFEDQGYNLKQLSATAFRGFKHRLGGNGHFVPNWEIDKYNHIHALDNVRHDGRQYCAADGAKYEKEGDNNFPLYSAAIEIRESDNMEGFQYVVGDVVTLVDTIPSYPFAIGGARIGTGDTFEYNNRTKAYIPDLTALNAYLASQNAIPLPDAGLRGQMAIVSGKIVYECAEDEVFDNGTIDLLTSVITFEQTIPDSGGVSRSLTAIFLGTGTSGLLCPYVTVESGAGTIYAAGDCSSTSPGNIILRADDNQTVTFALWHNNTVGVLGISEAADTAFGGTLTSITGSMPSSLSTFILTECGSLPSFDFYQQLRTARLGLLSASITNNAQLNDIGDFYVLFGSVFRVLKTINLSGNSLSSGDIDAFLNQMRQSIITGSPAFNVHYGNLNASGQQTSAPPTGASALARSTLSGSPFFWTLTFDT